MVKVFKCEEYGFEVEIGKVALQANGAVWFKQGGTILLATATSAASEDFPGFFPLTVDYKEYQSAAGKIPGGFFKREGKSTDREVLTSRLIDRALRPLFPSTYFEQVQVLATVYSVDRDHMPNTVSLLACSLALTISDIPFLEPVGVVELGRVNGEWIINPTYKDFLLSDVRLVVAGTKEGICMVEGSLNEVSEKDFLDMLFKAHEVIKKLVVWQEDIARALGKEKRAIEDRYQWSKWTALIEAFLTEDKVQNAYKEDKLERQKYFDLLRSEFTALHETAMEEQGVPTSVIDYIFDTVFKDQLTELVFVNGKRIDGRKFDAIRPISVEVGLLPFTHGSALFTRGRTQALVSVTLGTGDDEQRIESLMQQGLDEDGSFILHYNFLPFSTGEVKSLRGPGRREVGHGHLAASAIKYQKPSKEAFPYVIRVVSDILESDGSSSMATACGAIMALMNAGVPVKKMISGIAMGLLKRKNGEFCVLSDISGIEDAFGLMDFKVVGTNDGVTAIQMDIKYKGGLTREIFEQALKQARDGRIHIMNEMKKVITEPSKELSYLVPKVHVVKINTDKIGAVIGGGGKTIREIIDQTGTAIDIEDDGTVKIFGGPDAKLDVAIRWVKTLAGQITRGDTFEGKIRRFAEFGMFVELVPGLDGLVHLSNMPKPVQKTFAKEYRIEDRVKVEVLEHDESNGRVSLRLLSAPVQIEAA
ncbi:polyribonucleotide nucleotidyltransferase [bacterium]|nr:MAG: polyribonucleotide nucleotidyltransferase [bacterium]QQR61520.1 MAG: polyribonucleotide nucleotidyltransferase [bacterium]QQR62952.1 MAG: polyribonucleotide nucleotidyltransferase [bacterium]